MPVSSESRGQIAICRLQGYIDKPMAVELDDLLVNALEEGAIHLIFDFSAATHIGSDGLKVILGVLRRVREQGGQVLQAGAIGDVHALLCVAGFLSLLGDFETADAAIASLQSQKRGPADA